MLEEKEDKSYLGYYVINEEKDNFFAIVIGKYNIDTSCEYEYLIQFDHRGIPFLKIYDDSWKGLKEQKELFESLSCLHLSNFENESMDKKIKYITTILEELNYKNLDE